MTVVGRFTLLVCLIAAAAQGQQAEKPREVFAPPAAAQSLVTAGTDSESAGAMRLSLDSAIDTAVERNLGVQIQRYDYRMSDYALRGTYGIFDWFAEADIRRLHREDPVTSTVFSSQSDQTIGNFGVSQLIPTGGSYRIGFNNNRSSSLGGFTFVNPAYGASLSLAANQPILRDFGVDTTRRGINIARNTLGISREAFRSELIFTTVAVEQAYLDLVFARRNLEVAKESLVLAKDQERITRIRIDVGASAPLDILQPRVAVATREEELIVAQALIRDAEDRLRQLMNLEPAEWGRPIIPSDEPAYREMTIDAEAAVTRAFQLRPELRQLELGTRTREILYRYARNQVLPQLDLGLTYGLAGLGGRSAEIDPITGQPTGRITRTTYTDALEQVFGNDFPSWSIGFTVGVPITNVGARSEAKRAELDLERARTDEESLRQAIAVDVRKAARDIDTASKQIVASRAAREAAEQNVDAERKRFENGLTTNFNVLLIQQQLSDARRRELQAIVFYEKAVANYHRAVGDILDVRNITIDEPEFNAPPSSLERFRFLNSGSYVKK